MMVHYMLGLTFMHSVMSGTINCVGSCGLTMCGVCTRV